MDQIGSSTEVVNPDIERAVIMQWYAYGHDFGNAEICGVLLKPNATKETTQVLTKSIPTAFTQLNTNIMRNLGVDTSAALIVRMEGEQASYGIGSVALVQSTDPWSGRGDMSRYASRNSLRALLGISASLISDPEYGLMVVTGLPAETYQKNAGLRKDIKAELTGVYRFSIDGGKKWRTCHIEFGTLIMEGAGALIAYGGKETGQGAAVLDIGGRTTDLYVARNQVPLIEYCKGKPLGVETATQMMVDAFENDYGIAPTRLEARGIMHAYAAAEEAADKAAEEAARIAAEGGTSAPSPTRGRKKTLAADGGRPSIKPVYPSISIESKLVPNEKIDQYVREAILHTGGEIASFVSSAWRSSDSASSAAARFSPVISIGGGVYYFFKAMKRKIPHLIRPTDDPIFANARGYARAAEQLLARKMQKALKTFVVPTIPAGGESNGEE